MEYDEEDYSTFAHQYSIARLKQNTIETISFNFSNKKHKFSFEIEIKIDYSPEKHNQKLQIYKCMKPEIDKDDFLNKLNFIVSLKKDTVELRRSYISLSNKNPSITILVPNDNKIVFEIIFIPFTPILGGTNKYLLARIMSLLSVTPAPIRYQDDSIPLCSLQAKIAYKGFSEEDNEMLVDALFPDYEKSILDIENGLQDNDITEISQKLIKKYYDELGIPVFFTESSVITKNPNTQIICVCPFASLEQKHPHLIQCGSKCYEIASVLIRESGILSTFIFNNYLGGNGYFKIYGNRIDFHKGYPKLTSFRQNTIFTLIYMLKSPNFDLKYKIPIIDNFNIKQPFVHQYLFNENSRSVTTCIKNTADLYLNSGVKYLEYNMFSKPNPIIPLPNPSGENVLEIQNDIEEKEIKWWKGKNGFEPYFGYYRKMDDEEFDENEYDNPIRKELMTGKSYKIFEKIQNFKRQYYEKGNFLYSVSSAVTELINPMLEGYYSNQHDQYILIEFYQSKVKIEKIFICYNKQIDGVALEVSNDYVEFNKVVVSKEIEGKTGVLSLQRAIVASAIRLTGDIACISTFDIYGALIE